MKISSRIEEARAMEDKIQEPMEQLKLFPEPEESSFSLIRMPKRLSKKAYEKKLRAIARETVTANSAFISRFSKEYLR